MAQLSSTTRYCSRCLSTFEDDHERCPNLACRRPRPASGWGRMYGPGDLFDRHYRIHNLLALGGAGVTYLAREVGVDGEEIGPRLALKVLFASRDEGPYLRRLATEAQIIQELDHPNIVQYLGFVHRAGHSPYLVTRFEAGGSLLDHIKRVGSLSAKQAAQICRQICWSLDKAHSMGVVHRDLKPENVLLARVVGPGEDPVVRVADFGIAKVQGGLGNVTRVGAFVGTPQYAAPEQFIGGSLGPSTDTYAVGALAYFCTMVLPVCRFADRLDPEDGYQLLVDSLPPVVVRSHDNTDDVRRLNRILELCCDPDPNRRCNVEELDGLLGALLANREPDIESLRPANLSPSPTLTAEPDTHERLMALPADPTTPLPLSAPAGSAEAPTERAPRTLSPLSPPAGQPLAETEQAPLRTSPDAETERHSSDGPGLGLLAGVAAGAAVGVAAGLLAGRQDDDDQETEQQPLAGKGADLPAPGTVPLATASVVPGSPTPTVETVPTASSPAPAADLQPDPDADGAAPPAPRNLLLPGILLALVVGLGAVAGGWAWLAWSSPGSLPSAVRLAPVRLDPASADDAATIDALRSAIVERLPEVRSRCGATEGSLTVRLVVEPAGQVRSVGMEDVVGVDARCAGETLTRQRLPAVGWRPVRLGLALEL